MGPGELHPHRGPDASLDPSTWDLQFTEDSVISSRREDSMISPRRGQTGAQGREPTLPAHPPMDPHVSLQSKLMTPELKKCLEEHIQKFKEHLIVVNVEDMAWTCKAYDQNEKVVVHLVCNECHSTQQGGKKGVMDKNSIKSCFNNMRNAHMTTAKHVKAIAKNKGQTIDNTEIARRVKALQQSAKQVLSDHLAIVESLNSSHSVGSDESVLFEIKGDTTVEDIDLSKYRVLCTVCGEHMTLGSKQDRGGII
ncbi:unnamed protein product [Calypogeia fissa]